MTNKTNEQGVDAEFRLTTADDMGLETFDHTRLSAINTCITWGILRYSMHKKMKDEGRAMSLEAGSAMHEVFAFIRLVTLLNQMDDDEKPEDFVEQAWLHHGNRLFGAARLEHIKKEIKPAGDVVEVCKRGAIAVLDTSGFYDDPRDKRRTLSNLEECAYAYVNRWRFDHRVWVRDPDNASSDVGIEIPFDLVVTTNAGNGLRFRLTGRIDGIHWDNLGRLTVHDNKTASRLGDAWTMAQQINHQYTGYCVAASVFSQHVVRHCDVLGLAIPLPKTYDYGGFTREPMMRHDHHIRRWVDWLVHTILLAREFKDDPINAPKYTHSCNRYFRPCPFIPFCYADDDEQRIILEEMVHDEWTPLDKPTECAPGTTQH